jgi:predicted transcriptional regulator
MTVASVRPVAIKIDDDIKFRIKRLAEARQRTSHWLMREAITQYVDREEKRENFRQDTLKTSNTAYPSPSDKALPPVDRCANA